MKSETDVREELGLQEQDLRVWRDKYKNCSEKDTTRRLILGNTIIAIEERIETLKWILE